MNQIGEIRFKEISRISPSQYCSMKNCSYKSLLAEAFDKKPLLPVSPNAYFGRVLHKVLELIAKGDVNNDDSLNMAFNNQVALMENELKTKGYGFFVPLQKSVKDFGIKKVLLRKHLINKTTGTLTPASISYLPEKWLESKDKLIGGQVDLIIESGSHIEIVDFKTGSITQDVLDDSGETFADVKEEYKDQLKIYAYLYFENTSVFPAKLTAMNLAKDKFAVDFSHDECKSIFHDAKQLLSNVNKEISSRAFTANPTETNCKYCLYRPACAYYLQKLEHCGQFNDAYGLIRNTLEYKNGNVSLFLESGERRITIIGLPSNKYGNLHNCIGKKVAVFNLRREAIDSAFSWTRTTRFYER